MSNYTHQSRKQQ